MEDVYSPFHPQAESRHAVERLAFSSSVYNANE